MPTAVHPKPPETLKQPQPAKVLFTGTIAVEKIEVVSNVRKKFDDKALKELAENIKSLGVISPITLRPVFGQLNKYHLVAGERRFRSAKLVGLKEIPARVLELDDQQALEYQAAENIHRKDLTPIEEAQAFKALLDAKKYTVKQLAELVDKSEVYVYRAIALLELPKKALEAIDAGELTPAHGHQLLRIPAERREEMLDDAFGETAADFKNTVDWECGKRLEDALFPKDKPYAGEVACSDCPFNSGNQGMLFDGAEKGRCLNSGCYSKKTDLVKADKLDAAKKNYPQAKFVEVFRGYSLYPGNRVRNYVVREELVKARTPKGDFGVLLDPRNYKPFYATPDKTKKSTSSASSGKTMSDPKGEFIAEQVERAFCVALVAQARTKPLEVARRLANDRFENNIDANEVVLEALGCKDLVELKKEINSSKSINDLLAIAAALDAHDLGEFEFVAGDLDVDVKSVRKKATEAAEKTWSAKNPAGEPKKK